MLQNQHFNIFHQSDNCNNQKTTFPGVKIAQATIGQPSL